MLHWVQPRTCRNDIDKSAWLRPGIGILIGAKRWSNQVTEHSDALDLKKGVFTLKNPRSIALSLKRSAEHSHRRKSDPYRSAMSMLTFYVNRASTKLSKTDRHRLEKAKDELRKVFHREA